MLEIGMNSPKAVKVKTTALGKYDTLILMTRWFRISILALIGLIIVPISCILIFRSIFYMLSEFIALLVIYISFSKWNKYNKKWKKQREEDIVKNAPMPNKPCYPYQQPCNTTGPPGGSPTPIDEYSEPLYNNIQQFLLDYHSYMEHILKEMPLLQGLAIKHFEHLEDEKEKKIILEEVGELMRDLKAETEHSMSKNRHLANMCESVQYETDENEKH